MKYNEFKEAGGMVKVTHEMQELVGTKWKPSEQTEKFISLDRFIKSYVEERWSKERRYGSMATPDGVYHNKTIVYSPLGDLRSVRHFEFVRWREGEIEMKYTVEEIIDNIDETELDSDGNIIIFSEIGSDTVKVTSRYYPEEVEYDETRQDYTNEYLEKVIKNAWYIGD